ncbi:MAG TPA: phage tail tape measure protein [Egibacteraceae bacterium]|nr:phage tail tape measure protein [Egibacteraceae bacterium]
MAERVVTVRYRALHADYMRATREMSASTQQFGTRVADVTRKNREHFDTLGKGMAVAGTAMVGSATMAARSAMQWESAFAGVRKTVDATEGQLAALSGELREMATQIPVTATELAGIGEAAGQLGVQTENIAAFTRTMADLGVATNMSSDQAATSLARLANITQLPQTEFDRLGSTIVRLGNNLATTESEITEMGLRIAGAGAQIGLAESEILAIGGALSSVGIEAEAGGSAISRVMINIASQVETSGDMLGEFARVAGTSAEEFAAQWREDPAQALVAFVTGLGDMERQGGSTLQTLEALGITEIRMRDALLRSAGAGSLLADAIGLANGAWKENNALTLEAEQRYQTAESRLQIARNEITDFAIGVGESVLPVLVGVAEAGAGLAGVLGDLPEPVQRVGGVATLAAGGLTAMGGAALLLLPRVVATKDALTALNITKATTLARMSSLAKFMIGPWGLAVGGATAGLYAWQQAAAATAEAIAEVNAAVAETSGEPAEALRAVREQFDAIGRSGGFATDVGRFFRQMIGGTTLGTERAEIFAAAVETVGETSARSALELVEMAEAAGLVARESDGSVTALSHMGDATVLTAMQIVNLGAAAEKQRREANLAAQDNSALGGTFQQLGADAHTLGAELGETGSFLDSLSATAKAAMEPLAHGFDPFDHYTR